MVDHYGGSDTREFRDVEALGRRLLEIGEVQGSNVKAEAALVLDVENLWAIEGAAGPRNCGMHYLETLQAHYKALWKMGVPVDVVDEECELSGYKLVIAPMLYLLRAGFEQKLRDFVGQGGTLVGTYHTGLVNENDLCYLGGWPGAGLMDLFGVWHETTDALYDDEKNSILMEDGRRYETSELSALIHLKGARTLGTYGEDFMVVSPDEGALDRNMYYASVLGVELGMFYKRRDYSRVVDGRNPIIAHEYLGSDVAGKDAFISDDIISSGESMLDIAYNLKARNAKRIFTYATYAIFTNGLASFDKAYQEGFIDGVFGSNLTYLSEELKNRPWFYEVDVSKYIAYFISALNHDMSISALIDSHKKIDTLLEKRKEERSKYQDTQLSF